MELFGRQQIYTDFEEIDESNLLDVLATCLETHEANVEAENYLWEYYKGQTPILKKTKEYRTEINSIVHENRAMQLVEFYQGYVFGEPIQYIRRGAEEDKNDEIVFLNALMDEKGKLMLDNELAEHMLVMGIGTHAILPNKDFYYDIYTVDPRNAFNVYTNNLEKKTILSVFIKTLEDKTTEYTIYTDNSIYTTNGEKIIEAETNPMKKCPLVEYSLNNVRMGIFEPVITLLDGIDELQSNRMDDIKQFVNAILVVLGGEISDEVMKSLKSWGALSLPDGVDAKYLTASLNQNDIQTLKADLLKAVTDITGMPERVNGSGGDTGSAILLRDGWEIADAKSKRIEIQFKKTEREMLSLVFNILNTKGIQITNADIDIRFTRRNYENIQTKSQVLISMLQSGKINPELAFTYCGMFKDPLLAYEMSRPYIEKEALDEGNTMS